MPQSTRYTDMVNELDSLRRHFLPAVQNPTGTYSPQELDYTRAYKILCHSEIESFLEDISLSLVEDRYSNWITNQNSNYVILCLIIVSKLDWEDSETREIGLDRIESLKLKSKDESVQLIIEGAVKQYRELIKDNNGVKKKNIKRITMPLGILLSDLDDVWINNMETFGYTRGSYAHSSRLTIRNLPDPFGELASVNNLLSGLMDIDTRIIDLYTR